MPAGDGASAACSVRYGPARAPLSGVVQCCGRPPPPPPGDGDGGGGCGPGGAVAHIAVAAGGAPPLDPPPPPPPHLPPPLHPPPPGGGVECVARYKQSPCSLGSLCSRGSQSPKFPAERGPAPDRCGGGDGCGAQSWWKTNGGGCAGLSWRSLSSEASPPHCPPPQPPHRHHPGPGGGGDGDDGAGDPLWSPFSPPMLYHLSALHRCPGVSNICQSVRGHKARKCKKMQENALQTHTNTTHAD